MLRKLDNVEIVVRDWPAAQRWRAEKPALKVSAIRDDDKETNQSKEAIA